MNTNLPQALTAFCLLLTISSFGQSDPKLLDILPTKDGKVYYSEVVQIDSTDKSKLYTKAKKWFVDQYKSAKDVIQLDDKENGEIIGKGYFETQWQANFMTMQKVNVWHTVKVSVKDNKYRYEISNFELKWHTAPSKYSSGGNTEVLIEDFWKNRESNAKKYFAKVDTEVKSIISSLERFMKAPIGDDW